MTKKFEENKTAPVCEILDNLVEKGECVCMVCASNTPDVTFEITQKASTLKSLRLCDKDIVNVLSALYDFPKNKIKEVLFKL